MIDVKGAWSARRSVGVKRHTKNHMLHDKLSSQLTVAVLSAAEREKLQLGLLSDQLSTACSECPRV